MGPLRSWTVSVSAALVLSLAVAGCGDDADPGGGAAATGSSTTAGATSTSTDPSASDGPDGATVDTTGVTSVTLAFWPGSQLDTSSGPPPVPDTASTTPRITQELAWERPDECVVWERTVAPAAGGGTRVNAATDFELDREADGTWVFTYRQNADRCGEEFATGGTVKTYRSDVLAEDPSTGQTGDALWVGVVDVRPS